LHESQAFPEQLPVCLFHHLAKCDELIGGQAGIEKVPVEVYNQALVLRESGFEVLVWERC